MISTRKPSSVFDSLSSRTRSTIRAVLLFNVILLAISGLMAASAKLPLTDAIDPVDAYLAGRLTFSFGGALYFATTLHGFFIDFHCRISPRN